MKKIFLLLLAIIIVLSSKAQFSNNPTQGNTSTLNGFGAVKATVGFQNAIIFTDTTGANANTPALIKNVPGFQIFTTSDNILWIRSFDISHWVKINSPGALGLNATTAIDSTTQQGMYYRFGNFDLVALRTRLAGGGYHGGIVDVKNNINTNYTEISDHFFGMGNSTTFGFIDGNNITGVSRANHLFDTSATIMASVNGIFADNKGNAVVPIPAQFNPIQGTNMTLTGTYPNITFNASGGGGSGTVTSIATASGITGGTITTTGTLKADTSLLVTHTALVDSINAHGGSPSWSLTGNLIIDSTADYVGTIGGVYPLYMGTANDRQTLKIETNGDVAIGGVTQTGNDNRFIVSDNRGILTANGFNYYRFYDPNSVSTLLMDGNTNQLEFTQDINGLIIHGQDTAILKSNGDDNRLLIEGNNQAVSLESGGNTKFKVGNSGATVATLTSSGDALLGIGLPNPTYPLHVVGTGTNTGFGINQMSIESTSSEAGMLLNNTGAGGSARNIFVTNNSSGVGADKLIIGNSTNSTADLTIDGSGKVGIGSINPETRFSVKGDGYSLGLMFVNTVDGIVDLGDTKWNDWYGTGIHIDDKTTHTNTYNASGGHFFTGGNVGIGTNTPAEKLNVLGNIRVDNIQNSANVFNVLSDTTDAKVGINATEPNNGNEVFDFESTRSLGTYLRLRSRTGGDMISYQELSQSANAFFWYNSNTGVQTFYHTTDTTDNRTNMVLETPNNNNYALHIYSEASTGTHLLLGANSDGVSFVDLNETNNYFKNSVGIGTASPTASADIHGSIATGIVDVNDADYTVLPTDNVIVYVTTLSVSRNVNLPSIASLGTNSFHLTIKSDGVATVNRITLTADGSDTIDGSGTYTINTTYGSVDIKADPNTGHWIITSAVL